MGLVHRWLQADAASGNATPHLDELLRILKDRPLRRRTVRSMEKTTAENAYDALWIALGEEHLGVVRGGGRRAARRDRPGRWPARPSASGPGSRRRGRCPSTTPSSAWRRAPTRTISDTVERLSRALVGIEADPEWMRLVEQGGEFKGSRVFGSDVPVRRSTCCWTRRR